jgi:hypothetical protein
MNSTSLAFRRMLPSLIWGAFVLIGLGFLLFRAPTGPVAGRDLPMNTYLFKGDFVPPEVTGRYVVAPNGIPAGAMLRPKDVALQPIMPTSLPPGGYFSIQVSPVEIAGHWHGSCRALRPKRARGKLLRLD